MEQKKSEVLDNIAFDDDQFAYRQLLKDLPAAVYLCDAEGHITFYNEAAAKLWGRRPELTKDLWCGSWKIYKADGTPLPLNECPMAIALKEGRAIHNEEIIVEQPDGSRSHIQPHPQPIFNESGILIGGLNMLMDITKQKQDQQALKESEERFRTIADSAPVMIWMSGTDKQCTFFNKGWCEFTGKSAEHEIGEGWTKGIHPEDIDRCLNAYSYAFDSRINFQKEYRLRRNDGKYRWIMCNGVPRYSTNGEFLGYVGSCSDIHDKWLASEELEKKIKERTVQLKKKNDELERSNNELASFSYIASHDLQEPLRKIITFSDKLRTKYKELIPVEGKDYLNRIVTSSERMTRLIEDVLNFSKVSNDEKFLVTDLNEVLANVLTDFDQRILEKGAEIHISDLPVISAVPLQMRQLFYNLISNAMKFCNEAVKPFISITSVKLTDDEVKNYPLLNKRNVHFKIIVKDNGIGFSQEYAERIFTIFQRLHGKSEYSGTGIGLALCRKITDNHNGTINAFSKEKEGAEFHIILPLKNHPASDSN